MIETYKILLRHYLIGIAITVIVFWTINEIPNPHYFQRHLISTITTIISIPLVGILMAKLLFSKLKQSDNGLYILSTLTITMTWILVLYVKAAAVGIIASIENGQSEFIDSLIGFTIYQLWVYLGLGFIHGIISGIFLTIDLKKNIKKINKTALNNK